MQIGSEPQNEVADSAEKHLIKGRNSNEHCDDGQSKREGSNDTHNEPTMKFITSQFSRMLYVYE